MPFKFDPFSPEFRADPYPTYHRLRAEDPVHELPNGGGWLISRYEHVAAVLRDRRFSAVRIDTGPPLVERSVAPGGLDALVRLYSGMMIFKDPLDHTRLRGLVTKAFTPRMVDLLRARIQGVVDDLIGAVADEGRMEAIAALAAPLPIMVIAELLGVPTAERAQFKKWSDDMVAGIDPLLWSGRMEQAAEAAGALEDYLRVIIAERRGHPRSDLLSALIAAQDQGSVLTEDELISTTEMLLIAGHETTTNLIGNGLLALLRHPAQMRRLRDDPSLIPAGVEELLRYDSPVQATLRRPLEEVEIGDRKIRRGEEVHLLLGAANRDPARFPAPDELDVGRPENDHVAFGHGIHYCLGAPLARIEGEIVLGTLLRRFRVLELEADSPDVRPVGAGPGPSPTGIALRGLKSLSICFPRDRSN